MFAQAYAGKFLETFRDYPTAEAFRALYDEMDYQRAVQAHIGATPLLNSMGFRAGLRRYGATERNNKILLFHCGALARSWPVVSGGHGGEND